MTYQEYIENLIERKYRGEPHRMLGQCEVEAKEMARVFPELTIVPGHTYVEFSTGPRKRAHWWLITQTGEIVDPTAGQYSSPIIRYEPYEDGDEVRLGKCMNCGAEIWGPPVLGRQDICSDECGRDLAAYLEGRHIK